MVFLCIYCERSFASQSNLGLHQRTAKYCLALRGTTIPENKCKTCGKQFTKAANLQRHSETCAERESANVKQILREKEEEIEELMELLEERNEEIKSLKERLAQETEELRETVSSLKLQLAEQTGMLKVKQKPSVVNNNTQYINPKLLTINCDTIPPLTIENVKKEVDAGKYTYDKFIRGENGLVDFISGMISDDEQRNYVCTDAARNKFHRLIETREWKEDNGANFLNKILDQLKDPASRYYKQITNMTLSSTEDRELGEILMKRTKPLAMGITNPKSKDRNILFNKIRTEVRKLAAV